MGKVTRGTVLFLGGSPPAGHGADMMARAIREAHSRSLSVHVTDRQAALDAAPGLVGLADQVSVLDFTEPNRCAAWVRGLRDTDECPDLVLSPREYAQVAVAEINDALGLLGNSTDIILRIRNKDNCRRWLRSAAFAQPDLAVCAAVADAREFVRVTTGPWILKPRDAMGSLGVSLVRDKSDLEAAVSALPGPGPFLIEEFVHGAEYSVEGIFLGGQPHVLAVTEKRILGPTKFVEVGHVLPAPLAERRSGRIKAEVCRALRALGMGFGVFHVELWWTPSGPVLGEVHGRPGGDWIHLLLSHAIPGLDLFGLVYDDFLGSPTLSEQLTSTRAAAVRFLVPPPGRIISITGFEQAAAHPAVLHASCDVAVGQLIGPLKESFDRGGVIAVGANTAAEADRLAIELAASVQFTCEPQP